MMLVVRNVARWDSGEAYRKMPICVSGNHEADPEGRYGNTWAIGDRRAIDV